MAVKNVQSNQLNQSSQQANESQKPAKKESSSTNETSENREEEVVSKRRKHRAEESPAASWFWQYSALAPVYAASFSNSTFGAVSQREHFYGKPAADPIST